VENSNGYVTNETTMAVDLYAGLIGFFRTFPAYAKVPFYIFGESYGGHYVPSIAAYIDQMNKASPPIYINMKGIGIGDGWVDPYIQTGSFAEFLYANDLINELEVGAAEAVYDVYKGLIDGGFYDAADVVGNGLLQTVVTEAGGVDVYDIRYFNGDPTDPLQDALSDYLNLPTTRSKMNATQSAWQACASAPYSGLMGDIERATIGLFPNLISKYNVMNYNGNKDLICNVMGTQEWTSAINWPGQAAYTNAQYQKWTVGGKTAGQWKQGGGLVHLVVNDAGHMSPFNQPQNTQAMLYSFIAGQFHKKA